MAAPSVCSLMFLADDDDIISDMDSTETDFFMFFGVAAASVIRDTRYKVEAYVEDVIPKYLPDYFQRMFRVSRDTFEKLLLHISAEPEMQMRPDKAGRPQVSPDKALLMTLWYLGSQETVKSIADRFDVQEVTFIRSNRKLLRIFCTKLMQRFISWPKDNEKQEIMQAFENKKGFPGVLGAIDATHISITASKDNEADYINRKGFHSVLLQAVCREDRRFTDVYCGWPGRVHDARVFRNSPFCEQIADKCAENHVIGDGAYPLSRFLLKPYRDNGFLTQAEKAYNKALCGTRSIIENCFGHLKGRFRRLQHINMRSVRNMVMVVITACVLHNICIVNSDELDDYFVDDLDNDDVAGNLAYPAQDAEGTLKRLLITRQLANR